MTRHGQYQATLLFFTLFALPLQVASRPKICIDPGHGGSDPGAVGVVQEAFVNLDISLRLRDLLQADTSDPSCGGEWTVLMTRSSDVSVTLAARVAYANSNAADRFVSIHNNAFDGRAHGTETYSYREGTTGANLRCHIQRRLVEYLGTRDRGCKTANFYVLRETSMPATLSECAFVDHPGDGAILSDPEKRQEAARAHLHALQAHYGLNPCNPAGIEPFPLMILSVRTDGVEGQERDFCTLGESDGIFDLLVGQRVTFKTYLENSGRAVARGVKLGIWVESPYLEVRRYDIYSDTSARPCGEAWCLDESNDNPQNPPHNEPGSSFLLNLHDIAPGETKMIMLEVKAAAFSVADADHPDVRAWVNHIEGYYHKETFDSTFTDPCSCQTFNNGDLRAYFETDVFDEEACDGTDNDCDGKVDESACAEEPAVDATTDPVQEEMEEEWEIGIYTTTSACSCTLTR